MKIRGSASLATALSGADGCGCRCHDEQHRLHRESQLRGLLTADHVPLHDGWWVDAGLGRPHFPCAFASVTTTGPRLHLLARLVEGTLRGHVGSSYEPLSVVLDDVVVALIPEDVRGGLPAVCDRVVAGATDASLSVRGGAGPLCREPSDYAAGLRRARWVIEVLAATGGQKWAAFDALGVYAILFDCEDGDRPDDFVARRLGPLIRYDEARRSDLVGTLHSLLEAGGVVKKAADQVFCHISTLKYRRKRIEELLDVDLRDPQIAFDLHLALKILWVRRHRARLDGVGVR